MSGRIEVRAPVERCTTDDVFEIPTWFRNLRVLIAHDWIVTWAGSERCVEQLLRIFPQADLVVGVLTPSMRAYNDVTRRARETWLGRLPGARSHHRWFLPLEGVAFASLDTSHYDLVISSSHAFAKCVRARPPAVHVCYCYSPPRYLWDLRDSYAALASGLERIALRVGAGPLRLWDQAAARNVDRFVGISRFVGERIKRHYGRVADVVYPPVARRGDSLVAPRGDFLLSLGRLVAYKRVDLAIGAAEGLGVRLVVAGEGPDRSRLESLAGPNTTFLGQVSEAEAERLLSSCAAFVFCAEEDFGIAMVEAQAAGCPVISIQKGGALETVIDGRTGLFFPERTRDSLCQAVERFLKTQESFSENALPSHAQQFGVERFQREFSRFAGLQNSE